MHGSSGLVVLYSNTSTGYPHSHEGATREAIARQLACLKHYAYGGEYDPARGYPARLYFVPSATIAGVEEAQRLGIRSGDDLFGGVVPHAFVATKAIAHPLVSEQSLGPEGWCREFPERVRDLVLSGYSAFTAEDARVAVARVLERGPARVKRVKGVGGRGQTVVERLPDLDSVLASIDPDELRGSGLVVEINCVESTTFSVGQVSVDGLTASYCGVQSATTDHRGERVYGGSHLVFVRGGFDALSAAIQERDARDAIDRAARFDRAARRAFPGLLTSRCNYDVIAGVDRGGAACFGVLEQSWRVGGASGAEVAALRVLCRDEARQRVRASSVEVYGDSPSLPDHATVLFSGVDAHVGQITKYACVDDDGDA